MDAFSNMGFVNNVAFKLRCVRGEHVKAFIRVVRSAMGGLFKTQEGHIAPEPSCAKGQRIGAIPQFI